MAATVLQLLRFLATEPTLAAWRVPPGLPCPLPFEVLTQALATAANDVLTLLQPQVILSSLRLQTRPLYWLPANATWDTPTLELLRLPSTKAPVAVLLAAPR